MVAAEILIAMHRWEQIMVGDAMKPVKPPAERQPIVAANMLITVVMSEMIMFLLHR